MSCFGPRIFLQLQIKPGKIDLKIIIDIDRDRVMERIGFCSR